MSSKYEIVNGPSKWDLAVNFFTEYDKRNVIKFTIKPGLVGGQLTQECEKVLELRIYKVEIRPVGGGESIRISGDTYLRTFSATRNFTAKYSFKTRQGWLRFGKF